MLRSRAAALASLARAAARGGGGQHAWPSAPCCCCAAPAAAAARAASSSSSSPPPHQHHQQEQQPWDESRFLDAEHQQEFADETVAAAATSPADRQRLLRELLRKTHAAEAAMARVLAGQQLVLRGGRPDAAFFAQQEHDALSSVASLLPRYRVRPSALLPLLQAAGCAAGAAAALAGTATRDAAVAALQEALTDLYNDQLRLLREAGLSDEAADVRSLLLRLRDLQRAVEGAPGPPDLLKLQQALSSGSLAGIGAAGLVAAAVKAAADAALAAAGKV